jgi:hypothetical protein
MVHPLLEPLRLINMPAPKSSIDGGEAWIIDDYYILTLNRPDSMYRSFESITGIARSSPIGIEHRTAISVFYRNDRNPHGPSARPIAVYSVERIVIQGGADDAAGVVKHKPDDGDSQSPFMLCKYYAGRHINLGSCQGDGTTQSDRDQLMKQFLLDFGISERPKLIGSIIDIEGHPETGVPVGPSTRDSNKQGCLPLFAFAMLIGLTSIVLHTLI